MKYGLTISDLDDEKIWKNVGSHQSGWGKFFEKTDEKILGELQERDLSKTEIGEFHRFKEKLSDPKRIQQELDRFGAGDWSAQASKLPRPNDSSYQYFCLKFCVLETLTEQTGCFAKADDLPELVEEKQKEIMETAENLVIDPAEPLLELCEAAANFGDDISSKELNMIANYIKIHNRNIRKSSQSPIHEYSWKDVFLRWAKLGAFPYVNNQKQKLHGLSTIETFIKKSLLIQGLVYRANGKALDDNYPNEEIQGVPLDIVPIVRKWLPKELSDKKYMNLLEFFDDKFNSKSELSIIGKKLDISTTHERAENRRRIINSGIQPSILLKITYKDIFKDKETLKNHVRELGLEKKCHLSQWDEMIDVIIQKFAEDFASSEESSLYEYIVAIGKRSLELPSELISKYNLAEDDKKFESLFEKTVQEAFEVGLNFGEQAKKMGQGRGNEPDGILWSKDKKRCILWDAKSTKKSFKLGNSEKKSALDYIRKYKNKQVIGFIYVAPDFSSESDTNVKEIKRCSVDILGHGLDVRFLTTAQLRKMITIWRENNEKKPPELSTFMGGNTKFNVDLWPPT